MRGLHLGAILAIGAAAARDADEPEADDAPERPDPIADLEPDPAPLRALGHLAGLASGFGVALPGPRERGSCRPRVGTFSDAETIERAREKRERKAAKRRGEQP
jgi:hypothetical protein